MVAVTSFFARQKREFFMKKFGFILSMLVMFLIFGLTVIGCGGSSSNTVPSNGTYTFSPRPRASSAGQPVNAYLDKVTISNGYATFYLTSVSNGKGNLRDIPGYWGTGSSKGTVVLQNLGNKDLSYNDVDADSFINRTGQYVSFDSIVGNRFSLSYQGDQPPIVFNEIVLRKPDKTDNSTKRLIYTTPGFDPADFTKMAYTDVINSTGAEGTYSGFYTSEAVFVSQNGKILTFKTEDGNRSREMQTKFTPPGLSAGEKVLIYYYVYSQYQYWGDLISGNEAWGIYAIERL